MFKNFLTLVFADLGSSGETFCRTEGRIYRGMFLYALTNRWMRFRATFTTKAFILN